MGIVAFAILAVHFNPLCGEEVHEEEPFPDGSYVAALMERNCGATTRYAEHINAAGKTLSPDFFAGVIKEGEIFGFEQRNPGTVRFNWCSNQQLNIHYAGDDRVWKLKRGVSIRYDDTNCGVQDVHGTEVHK